MYYGVDLYSIVYNIHGLAAQRFFVCLFIYDIPYITWLSSIIN